MTVDLKDKVIIVTGAGSGIGRGILRQAVAAGANVSGFFVSEKSEAVIRAEGGKPMRADVSNPQEFRDAIDAVRNREGRLDGLVNNAGVTLVAPFLDAEIEMWDELWRTNQRSVLVGCQAVAQIMVRDGRGGAMVNIASNHSVASDHTYEAYAGTKGAIVAMTRAMAWSLGRHGIRVNTLCPGLTMTEKVTEVASRPGMDERFRNWHATGEVSTVDEVGQAALFLLSGASSTITGAQIIADKGMSVRLGNIGD